VREGEVAAVRGSTTYDMLRLSEQSLG
jgi:hypothetical protein